MIPLSAVAHFSQGATPLAVNHQGLLVANTISFNLPPGVSLSDAIATIEATMNRLGVPATIRGTFQGSAKVFQDSLANQPFLVLAALVTIYIVLGVLYESYIHPLTILSTLPSAGVGALLALMAFKTEFCDHGADRRHPADRHRQEERDHDDRFRARRRAQARHELRMDAIREACLLRFRPIMMTTMAAMLGARSPGARPRRRRRAAPAAGNRDCRRSDPESSADALFHTCDLFVSGQVSPLEPTSSSRRGASYSRAFTATGRINVGGFTRLDVGAYPEAFPDRRGRCAWLRAVRLHPWHRAARAQSRGTHELSRSTSSQRRCRRADRRLVARLPVQRADLADGCGAGLQSRHRGRDRPDRAGRRPGRRHPARRCLPTLTGNGSAERQKVSSATSSVGSGNGLGGGTFNQFSTSLTASYMVDFWGKNRATLYAAEESATVSRYNREVVTLSTIVTVANTYFQVLAAQDELRVTRQNLAAADRILTLIKKQFNGGTASQLDVSQQEALVADPARRDPAAGSHGRPEHRSAGAPGRTRGSELHHPWRLDPPDRGAAGDAGTAVRTALSAAGRPPGRGAAGVVELQRRSRRARRSSRRSS